MYIKKQIYPFLLFVIGIFFSHCSHEPEPQVGILQQPVIDAQILPDGHIVLVKPQKVLLYQADGTLLRSFGTEADHNTWAQVLPGKQYALIQNSAGAIKLHSLGMTPLVIDILSNRSEHFLNAVVSPDQKELWILYPDRMQVFQMEDGLFVKDVFLQSTNESSDFLIDGRFDPKARLIVGYKNSRRMGTWDPRTGNIIQDLGFRTQQLALSEGPTPKDVGTWLAALTDDGGSLLWKLDEKSLNFDMILYPYYNWPQADPKKVKLDVSGGRVWLPTIQADGVIKIHNATNGLVEWSIPMKGEIEFARTDGNWLLVGTQDHVQAFSLELQVTSLAGHKEEVTAVAFSSDGTQIVTGSADHTVKIWKYDGTTWQEEQPAIKVEDSLITSVAFAPNNLWIAIGHDTGTLELVGWQAMRGQPTQVLSTIGVQKVLFSSQGKWLISANHEGTLDIWSFVGGLWSKSQRLVEVGTVNKLDSVRFSISTDENVIVVTNQHATMVWNFDSMSKMWVQQSIPVLYDPKSFGIGIDFSADTKQIWVINTGRTTTVWNNNGTIWVPDMSQFFLNTWSYSPQEAVFSPDKQYFVTIGEGTVARIWDWDGTKGTEKQALLGHTEELRAVAISNDGKWIVTGSKDKTAKLWNMQTPQALGTFSWN